MHHLILTRTDKLLTFCLSLWLGSSQVRSSLSFFSLSLHLWSVFSSSSSHPQTLVLFPHSSHPLCLPRHHIKVDDCFWTVKQAVFYSALCDETKIISINMEKPATMVISSLVISISVKLTWLHLTYTQTGGSTVPKSPWLRVTLWMLPLTCVCKYSNLTRLLARCWNWLRTQQFTSFVLSSWQHLFSLFTLIWLRFSQDCCLYLWDTVKWCLNLYQIEWFINRVKLELCSLKSTRKTMLLVHPPAL